jgi:hypothetical protein
MRDRRVRLSFDCPHCRSGRIEMDDAEDVDYWKGVRCLKCQALIVLDSLSVVVIKERPSPGGP